MTVPFAVLKHFHPMIGYDLHLVMPPGSPVPGPPGPHVAMSALMGTGATAQMGPTEQTHFGWTILRGSDIGPLIPHAPLAPNCLLPIILLASGSKSHFGSSQYLVQNKPAAAALLVVVNPNLNCADPCPMPLDGVIAINAHFVDMTLGDIISGLLHMAADAALAFALNWLGGKLFNGLSQRLYESALFGPMMSMFERMGYGKVSTWLLQHDFQEMMAKGFFAKLGALIGADFLGSPLGYSFPINAFGLADSAGGTAAGGDDRGAMEDAHDAVQRYIDSPSVETHDAPPAAASDSAGASSAGAPDAGVPSDAGDASTASADSTAPGDGGAAGGSDASSSTPAGAQTGDASPSAGTGSSSAPSSTASATPQSAGDQGGVCESPGSDSAGASSSSAAPSSASSSTPADDQGGVCLPGAPGTTGGNGTQQP
jgi:hypothetical protein